jgi:TolA-binding protein
MAEAQAQQVATAVDDVVVEAPEAEGESPAWSGVWHVPVLVLGLVLLALGALLAIPRATPDDFPGALDTIEQYLAAGNLEEAATHLETVDQGIERAAEPSKIRHELLHADLIHRRQHQAGVESEPALRKIIERYVNAKKLGHDFAPDDRHWQRWIESLISLGEDEQAQQMIDRLDGEPLERRYGLLRRIITRLSARDPAPPPAQVLGHLAKFQELVVQQKDSARRRVQQIWALTMQGELLLEAGDHGGVLDLINPRRAALAGDGDADDLAPLIVLTAEAHRRLGRYDEAHREFQLARMKMAALPDDPIHARILVGLAHVALAGRGDTAVAIEHFSETVTTFPTSPSYPDAVIGLADTEARLGRLERAKEHFTEAIEGLGSGRFGGGEKMKMLLDTILAHHERLMEADEPEQALTYLELLQGHYGTQLPSELLISLAVTHERLARKRIDPAGEHDDKLPATLTQKERELRNRQTALAFGRAGDFYARHAEAVVLLDDAAFGNSLWRAAECYDGVQRWGDAIRVWTQLRDTRPEDPRHLEGVFRLAHSQLAAGEHAVAGGIFQEVIDQSPSSRQAHASRLPLAHCLVQQQRMHEAVSVLNEVLSDHNVVTPKSKEYREALIELGKLHCRMNKLESACSRLEEAATRYPDDDQAGVIHGYLGDAYRRSIAPIDRDLAGPLDQDQMTSLKQERRRRLERAQAAYTESIHRLEARPEAARTSIEQVMLRNSYFYRGDCAYALERYREAIGLYDQAAKRWHDQPASLVALMQIVNAYCAMDQLEDAAVAVRRARFAFRRIPDGAFDDPDMPITREHWQEWFKWTAEMESSGGAETDGRS